MALIEGVGDEVTLLFGALLLLLVLVLAWASTHTAEPPDHLFTAAAVSASSSSSASSLQSSSYTDQPSSSSSDSRTDSEERVEAPSPADSPGSLTPPTPDDEAKEEEAGGTEGEEGGQAGLRHRQVGGREEAGDTDSSSSSQRNMVVRLKFLNDTERTAQVKPQDTIGYIKRTYFAGQEQQVRLIYQGQLLQDDAQTLASLNLAHNCVLHCHISQHAPRGAAAGARPADQVQVALNVGSLMVPLLVLMLSVLWYCQIQYRQFFTAPATASLVGVTIFLSLVAFGVYRR
ncbi:transmembrane and ubiquitin-like domain-containing protein 1 [Myripristis murdjan]|uniref:Transmembrane and ubiquitin-like domain-containing protein 1 n=1 Tax=Myripristis murdjan TaxID=586833 RepID=A0A667XMW7_9TELE|nr:transmembrane and ubiquitin-like domain-containing protein 1 [Myripristis murdjan]